MILPAGSRPLAALSLQRRLPGLLGATVACFFWATAVFAQDPAAPAGPGIPSGSAVPTPPPVHPQTVYSNSGRMVSLSLYFVVLVSLAGVGLYLLRNGMPVRGIRSGDARKLQIVEMRALGNRQFLLVVEYEQSRMLLGVTSGRIDYLCPLDGAGGGRFEAPPEPVGAA